MHRLLNPLGFVVFKMGRQPGKRIGESAYLRLGSKLLVDTAKPKFRNLESSSSSCSSSVHWDSVTAKRPMSCN